MEGVLWQLLASSRGGPTRTRLLSSLAEHPRNANELANELDLDYTTIRHHLDILCENNVVKRTDNEYGAVYLVTDQVKAHWEVVEEIFETMDGESS